MRIRRIKILNSVFMNILDKQFVKVNVEYNKKDFFDIILMKINLKMVIISNNIFTMLVVFAIIMLN